MLVLALVLALVLECESADPSPSPSSGGILLAAVRPAVDLVIVSKIF